MDFTDHLLCGKYNRGDYKEENMVPSQENLPCSQRDHMCPANKNNCILNLPYEYCVLRPIKAG